MDFDLNEEQRLLKDSVDRLIERQLRRFRAAQGVSAARRTAGASSSGRSTPSSACSALPFAESEGGFGGGPVETMLVDGGARPRRSRSSRYLATVVLGGGFLRHGGSDAAARAS